MGVSGKLHYVSSGGNNLHIRKRSKSEFPWITKKLEKKQNDKMTSNSLTSICTSSRSNFSIATIRSDQRNYIWKKKTQQQTRPKDKAVMFQEPKVVQDDFLGSQHSYSEGISCMEMSNDSEKSWGRVLALSDLEIAAFNKHIKIWRTKTAMKGYAVIMLSLYFRNMYVMNIMTIVVVMKSLPLLRHWCIYLFGDDIIELVKMMHAMQPVMKYMLLEMQKTSTDKMRQTVFAVAYGVGLGMYHVSKKLPSGAEYFRWRVSMCNALLIHELDLIHKRSSLDFKKLSNSTTHLAARLHSRNQMLYNSQRNNGAIQNIIDKTADTMEQIHNNKAVKKFKNFGDKIRHIRGRNKKNEHTCNDSATEVDSTLLDDPALVTAARKNNDKKANNFFKKPKKVDDEEVLREYYGTVFASSPIVTKAGLFSNETPKNAFTVSNDTLKVKRFARGPGMQQRRLVKH